MGDIRNFPIEWLQEHWASHMGGTTLERLVLILSQGGMMFRWDDDYSLSVFKNDQRLETLADASDVGRIIWWLNTLPGRYP